MRATLGIFVTLLVALAGIIAFSHRGTPSLGATQIPVNNMNLTSITRTSAGLVTAGELGHILVSGDQGESWQLAKVSHQRHALITRLQFTDDQNGFAIGHEGWILRTSDGGLSWDEVSFTPGSEPLLSIAHLPDQRWMAVGAFGQTLVSSDQGMSWERANPPEGTDWHLNKLVASEDQQNWLLVGEAGTVFRSLDAGNSWQSVSPFYNGSFYGGLHLGGDSWLLYGMRGNIFRSDDNGLNWQAVGGQTPASLFTHIRLNNDNLILAGQGGLLLLSDDNGRSFRYLHKSGRMTLTGITRVATGTLLMSSDKGLLPPLNLNDLKLSSGA